MSRTREQIRESRHRAKVTYGELFDATVALLFRHDPIGINFDINTEEYETETETILPRLRSCQSQADALRVVHEEFIYWFGADTAGPPQRYAEISLELWQLWQADLKKPNQL